MTFEQLFAPSIPKMRSVALSLGLSKEDSEDLTQDAAIHFWKKLAAKKIDSAQNVEAYFCQFVRWRAKDFLRSKKVFQPVSLTDDLSQFIPAPEKEDDSVILNEIISCAQNNLRKREKIYFDRFMAGKKVSEIGAELNLDNQGVYLLKCRIFKKLKSKLIK